MTYTQTDLDSLEAKLQALDLAETEHAALVDILRLAGSDDVQGFAYDLNPNDVAVKQPEIHFSDFGLTLGLVKPRRDLVAPRRDAADPTAG